MEFHEVDSRESGERLVYRLPVRQAVDLVTISPVQPWMLCKDGSGLLSRRARAGSAFGSNQRIVQVKLHDESTQFAAALGADGGSVPCRRRPRSQVLAPEPGLGRSPHACGWKVLAPRPDKAWTMPEAVSIATVTIGYIARGTSSPCGIPAVAPSSDRPGLLRRDRVD